MAHPDLLLRRSVAVTPPAMFDELLDRMVLTFENLMTEYRRARDDHVEEADLCKQLFELVVSLPLVQNPRQSS
jgi:hypothetical protein